MASRSSRLSLSVKKRQSRKLNEEDNTKLKVQFISDNDITKVCHGMDLQGQAKVTDKTESTNVTQKSERKLRTGRSSIHPESIKEETRSEEESECDFREKCEKPRDLCDEDDIGGDEMCNFRTPSKRQGMIQKARESAKNNSSGTPKAKRTPLKAVTPKQPLKQSSHFTPRTNMTPSRQTPKRSTSTPSKNVGGSSITIAKTPYNTRAKTINAIKVYKKQLECDSEEEDEDSDSDYEGSSSEKSESEPSGQDSDSDSGKGSEGPRPICRRSLRFQPVSVTPSSKGKSRDLNYVFTADEYFESKSTKCKTSDHVLSRLRTPRLDTSDVVRLLKKSSVVPGHCSVLTKHHEGGQDMYERWMIALSQQFSILAYGLGSKYKILQNFHRRMLPDSHVLVVNGFFPSLNIKEIVETIARDLLGLKHTLPSPHAVIDWIESRRWMPRVFLLVHNIDAEPLRCDKTQQLLAQLASLPRVHLIASVDHINCPLLWDQAKLSAFNFMWEDVTSFLPYTEETSYETSLMVHNSGSLALSSLLNVYRSLTHNSRGVFRIILQKHLDENNTKYNGMAFSDLYGRCREEMLVTSDLALRTMLTEFLDHQMVKWRKDGEHLYIPTDIGVLRQFSSLTQND